MNLRAIWRSIVVPSLARRLMLAQMALLLVVWLACVGYFVYDIAYVDQWYEPRQMQERADMILAVIEGLADRPKQLDLALRKIDEFQRDENRERDDPGVRVTMNAWFGDELVYGSPGEPGLMTASQFDVLEASVQHGRRVRTFARQAVNSPARVVLIMPGDAGSVALTLWSSGIVLLPLLICMPLLIVPAWLSVRFALRPFRELAHDVAGKGPQNLEPLAFRAPHLELRPIVKSVNGLLNRLREGVQRERRFIADAAHELRTPLAAMRINIEALRERSHSEKDGPLLDSLIHSGDRATRLVGQLLSLMRSDAAASQLQPEMQRLDELLQEQLAVLASIARLHDVELELDLQTTPVWVRGEREQLLSLLQNLVENAIKYSPYHATVAVQLTSDSAGSELTITDHGPGIPPQLRSRVFDRFFRVGDQAQQGSGLGLAIVKTVSEQLGASIALEEPDRGGLRVRVRFPSAS